MASQVGGTAARYADLAQHGLNQKEHQLALACHVHRPERWRLPSAGAAGVQPRASAIQMAGRQGGGKEADRSAVGR